MAQFDLAELADGPGLDPALPRRGLLSVFCDVTWDGRGGRHWVYWHDAQPADLARVDPPEALVDLYERASVSRQRSPAWAREHGSERLHPFAAVTIPDQWWEEMVHPERGEVDPAASEGVAPAYSPAIDEVAGDGPKRDGRDRLGGWPDTFLLSSYPEDELARDEAERDVAPGRTPFRHIWSSENWVMDGTRCMDTMRGHGDRVHLLIRHDALAERRFEEVETAVSYEP